MEVAWVCLFSVNLSSSGDSAWCPLCTQLINELTNQSITKSQGFTLAIYLMYSQILASLFPNVG